MCVFMPIAHLPGIKQAQELRAQEVGEYGPQRDLGQLERRVHTIITADHTRTIMPLFTAKLSTNGPVAAHPGKGPGS